MLYALGFSTKEFEGDMVGRCALGRGIGDEVEEDGLDEMDAEMLRGSRATPMLLDLVRSGSKRSAGKGAGVGAEAIFYPSSGV